MHQLVINVTLHFLLIKKLSTMCLIMWRTIYHLDSQQIHCKPDVLLNPSCLLENNRKHRWLNELSHVRVRREKGDEWVSTFTQAIQLSLVFLPLLLSGWLGDNSPSWKHMPSITHKQNRCVFSVCSVWQTYGKRQAKQTDIPVQRSRLSIGR